MSSQIDFSIQLNEIGEIFVAGLRLAGPSQQSIPDRLLARVEELAKSTPIYLSMNSMEMIMVAVLFHNSCTGFNPGWRRLKVLDLLNQVYSEQTPVSDGLRVVKSLCDHDITYARKYLGRPAATAYTAFGNGAITDLFYDTVVLSERTVAWIVGDDLMMGYFGRTPYSSNVEFLNDWIQAINHARDSDGEWYCDHPYWNFVFGSTGALRELDRVSRRLQITTIKIPFQGLVYEYSLSPLEQLVIMYDLHTGHREHSWSVLNKSIFCKPHKTLTFIDRPPLTEESRLVRMGLFERHESTDDSVTCTYHLSPWMRAEIISGADENRLIPLI